MKKLITLLLVFVCIVGNAQLPDSVKHVEIISEVQDTMFLLNKPDLDVINTAFYKLEVADTLNVVNDEIITGLSEENTKLNNIISEQDSIITNKDVQITNIKEESKEVISDLEKQVKKANGWNIFWQSATGACVIAILLIVLL